MPLNVPNDGLNDPTAWQTAADSLLKNDLATQVNNSVSQAQGVNPDAAALANARARALGIPTSSAAAYPNDVARQVAVQAANAPTLVQQAPAFARGLTDQHTANMVHDDIHTMSNLEQTIRAPKPTPVSDAISYLFSGPGSTRNLMGDLGTAWGAANAPLLEGLTKVFQAAGAPALVLDALAGTKTADLPFAAAKWAEDNAARLTVGKDAPFWDKLLGTAGSTIGVLSEALATGGASVAPKVGATALEALGGLAAHGTRAMLVPSSIAAQKTSQDVLEQGGTVGQATGAGLASYATNTAGGVIPFATPGALATRLAAGATMGELLGINSHQLMNAALPDSMQQPEQTWEDHALQMLSGSIFGGLAGPKSLAHEHLAEAAAAAQAEHDFAKFGAISQLSTLAKLRERDPVAFHQMVESMSDDSELKAVYVDGRVLQEAFDKGNVTPDEVRDKLPAVATQMKEALETNGFVRIPVADYATHIAGGPLDADLLQHLKTDPAGKTYAEAQEFYQGEAEKMKSVATKMVADKEQVEAFRTSQQAVQDDLHQQLDALGKFPTAVNKVYATVQSALLSRIAAAEKITPEEAYAKYGNRLSTEPIDTLNALGEGPRGGVSAEGYHYSKEERNTLSTDRYGTGLRGSGFDTFSNAADPRLRKRLSFYVDKGTGINPEAGVGGIAHRAQLDNLYDANTDPLRLRKGSQTDFESAVLDHGYSGYLDRMEGTQSAQAILLGDQAVAPEKLGPMSATKGRVVAPAGERASLGRDQIVDSLVNDKTLPSGALTPERWAEVLQGRPELKALQDAGALEGTEPMYKSELLKSFESKTPAPDYKDALYQSARSAGDTKYQERAVELSADMRAPTRSSVGIMDGSTKVPLLPTNFDIARYFTKKNAMGDFNSPAARKAIVDSLHAEAVHALKDAGSGVGWYDRQMRAAIETIATLHPELLTDEQAKFGFISMLAITSNSTKVNENFAHANTLYTKWKQTGEWPSGADIADSKAAKPMREGFVKLQTLVAEHGWQAVRDFMVKDHTRAEIEKFTGVDIPSELAESKIPGATFLGSKVGAFFNNLYGNFTPVTMDRWFMRTINRLRGNMLALPERFGDNLAKLSEQIDSGIDTFGVKQENIKAEIEVFNALPEDKKANVETVLKTMPETMAYAKARWNEYQRGVTDSNGVRHGYAVRSAENVLAKILHESFTMDEQTPAGGADRAQLRTMMLQLQARLHGDGIPIEMADLQAVLWYYEKDLFDTLKGSKRQASMFGEAQTEAEDYATAAQRVVRSVLGSDAESAGSGRSGRRPAGERATDTTGSLFQAGAKPTVNIGLDIPGGGKVAPEEAVAALRKIGVEVTESAVHQSDTEQTLVAHLDRALTPEEANAVSVALKQEAIAQMHEGEGELHGPKAADWRPFNPAYFLTMKGERAAELAQEMRGAYSPSLNTITLLKSADLSTYLHETGHWVLDTYSKIAAGDAAPPAIRADLEGIMRWFGIDSIETWNDMSLAEQRPFHEKFARGFERYLFEGKAPSAELSKPFARIRAWMTSIYQSLGRLNVELTPEVRGVFDRMLASEEAITQTEAARNMQPLFHEKPETMTVEEWNAYIQQGQDATAEAVASMQDKSLRDMKWLSGAHGRALKRLQAEAKGARTDIENQVATEVHDMPVYRMEDWLKENSVLSEADRDAAKDWRDRQESQREKMAEAVKAEYLAKPEAAELQGIEKGQYLARNKREMANEAQRRLLAWEKENPKPKFVKPDVDMQTVAEQFGFKTGDEALQALRDAAPRKEVIEGMTDQRMLEEHGELTSPQALDAAASAAVHNEARARFVATGLRVLTKAPISARELTRGAREAATAAVGRKTVGSLNARQYEAAETRANRDALRLVAKKPEEAIDAQRAALLNHELVRAVNEAVSEASKAIDYFKRLAKNAARAKIDTDEREVIDGLLSRFDFRQNPPEGPTKKQIQLETWVESQKALGYAPLEHPDMLNPDVRMHYKDMTVDQLRGLRDTIASIEKIGRQHRSITVDGKRMEVGDAVLDMNAKMLQRGEKFTDAQLATRADRKPDPLWRAALDRAMSLMRSLGAELKPQHFKANRYDMHEILGPFHRFLFEPVFDANYHFIDMRREAAETFRTKSRELGGDWQKSLTEVVGNHKLMDNSLDEPQLRSLTRGDLISIAMHVGNESNFDKLTKGMVWKPEDVWQALHDNMRREDWEAARTLGEVAGAHWPEMAAMNKRLGNDSPERIEPRPFPTQFGDMPGWYAPIRYDPIRSKLGIKKADALTVNPEDGTFGRQYYRADTTTNGSLNARASGYYDFIDLNFKSIEKAIQDGMRDLAYREAMIDAHKLYIHSAFRKQFQRTYGPEEYEALGRWLGRLVNQDTGDEHTSKFSAIMATTRRAVVANGIAFRISTIEKHGGSAGFKSLGFLTGGGEKYFAARVAAMLTNHSNEVGEALAKFSEIRARSQQQDRDFSQSVTSLLEPESWHGKAERFGHAGVAYFDFFTAVPTAHAAYDWAITEGIPKRLGGTGKPMSADDAARWASSMVREAHGTNIEAGRSNLINNRSELVKNLTILHGFMNNSFGQHQDILDKLLHANGFGKPELVARYMMAQIAPAALAGYITFGGPTKDQTWAGWLFHNILAEYAGFLPMVREAWSAIAEGHESAGMPPWIRALSSAAKAGKDVAKGAKGEPLKHPIKDAGDALGLFVPGLGQAGATTQFLADVNGGKQRPQDVADWVHGVTSGHLSTK